MTNWAPDYTPRLIVHYTSAGLPHTWTLRANRGSTAGSSAVSMLASMSSVVTALSSLLCNDLAVTSAFWIDQDTDIQIPIPGAALTSTGTNAISGFTTADKATELRFPGKSLGGLVHHISFFGIQLTMDSNAVDGERYGRMTAAQYATIAAAVAAFAGSRDFVANDNRAVVWYDYATNKVNDYWWKQARKTGGL